MKVGLEGTTDIYEGEWIGHTELGRAGQLQFFFECNVTPAFDVVIEWQSALMDMATKEEENESTQ